MSGRCFQHKQNQTTRVNCVHLEGEPLPDRSGVKNNPCKWPYKRGNWSCNLTSTWYWIRGPTCMVLDCLGGIAERGIFKVCAFGLPGPSRDSSSRMGFVGGIRNAASLLDLHRFIIFYHDDHHPLQHKPIYNNLEVSKWWTSPPKK